MSLKLPASADQFILILFGTKFGKHFWWGVVDFRFGTTRPDQNTWVHKHPWWCWRSRMMTAACNQDLNLPGWPGIIICIILFFMMRFSCSRHFNLSKWQQQDHKWHDEIVYLSTKDLNFQKGCAALKHCHKLQDLFGGRCNTDTSIFMALCIHWLLWFQN